MGTIYRFRNKALPVVLDDESDAVGLCVERDTHMGSLGVLEKPAREVRGRDSVGFHREGWTAIQI